MPEVKGWNVRRMWWELTKLLFRGIGGYNVYFRVNDLSDEAQEDYDSENWGPVDLHWTDDRDHFVVVNAEPVEATNA